MRRNLYDQVGGYDEVPLMEDFRFSQKIGRLKRYSLLAGPINVSARRWQSNGPLRQTVTNWMMVIAYLRGVDPEILFQRYYDRD